MIKVSENELLEAIRAADRQQGREYPDALTSYEIMQMTGRGEKSVRRILRTLVNEGAVEPVTITCTDIAGRQNHTIAYRVRREQPSA